jgi:hypothetical protein
MQLLASLRSLARSRRYVEKPISDFVLNHHGKPYIESRIWFSHFARARALRNKVNCLYFRHAALKPHVVINLENAKVDLGNFNQIEFDTKEDLLRKALRCFSKPISSTDRLPSNNQVVYCRRCGATPGEKSECIGIWTAHDFVTGSGTIYCRRCGKAPGRKSECTGIYTAHDFVST